MIDVKETLQKAEERMEMAAMFLEEELNRVRAGRANVAILDGVRVESYGSRVPLNQVANVSCPDARTIAIKPWDRKQIRDIEKAIKDGLSEDNEKDAEADLQKLHDKYIKKLDELMEAKNKEIMTV